MSANGIYTSTPKVLQYNNERVLPSGNFENLQNNPFPLNRTQQLSVIQEPKIAYEEIEVNIVVNSKDRDTNSYPNPNKYRINLPYNLKNIKSIELLTVVFPDRAATGSILQEPCLNICVEEINHLEFSDTNINKAFAVVPLKPPNVAGGFLVPELGCVYNTPCVFKTPLASLSHLTISITDMYGILFNFGTDTNPPTKYLQNVMVFKVTTLEKSITPLNQRNVY